MTTPTPAPSPQPAPASAASPAVAAPGAASIARDQYDVVIVGGGAAGLSAATALGRARRRVLVVDAGDPRNAPAEGVHNFLTREGLNPLELQRIGREDAAQYGVEFISGVVEDAERSDDGFAVTLHDGTVRVGKRLVIASGLRDELPPVEGLREHWGHDVLHCPYCHGWEVRDRKIGVLGSGSMAMHQTILFSQWSDDVTLFLGTAPEPSEEESEQLAARGIPVIRGIVSSVRVDAGTLSGLVLEDGAMHAVDAVVVAPRFSPRVDAFAGLGIEPAAHTSGYGTYVVADEQGRTPVPGVWAIGNVSNPMAQVVLAAGTGMMAGAIINAELVNEEVAADVERYRARGR